MDIIQKAAAKAEELRASGWNIKGVWTSKATQAPLPEGRFVFLLKMDKPTDEQMNNLHMQIQKEDPWIVLFDYGQGYTGLYSVQAIMAMRQFLRRGNLVLVWEAASERKGRKTAAEQNARKAKASGSSRRSGT